MLAQPNQVHNTISHEPSWSNVFNCLGHYESIHVDKTLLQKPCFKVPHVSLLDPQSLNADLTVISSTCQDDIQNILNQLNKQQQLWVVPTVKRLSLRQLLWLLKSCHKAFDVSPSLEKPLKLRSHAFGPHYMARMQYQHQLPKWLIALKVYAQLWFSNPNIFVFEGMHA